MSVRLFLNVVRRGLASRPARIAAASSIAMTLAVPVYGVLSASLRELS